MSAEIKEFPMNFANEQNVMNWTQKFESVVDNDRINGDHDRIFTNFAMYSGVNKGQWDKEALERLRQEGRPAHTFNLILPKVTDKVGQLDDNPTQTNFVSREPENQDDVNVMQKLYDYDFATGGWQSKLTQMKRDGCIHTGILQPYINYERDPLGNVDFRVRNATQTWFDSNWQTENIKDCRYAFTSQWLTAAQIKEQYKAKSEAVDNAIRMHQFQTDDNDFDGSKPTFDRSSQWYNSTGGKYKVVEALWMERCKVRKVFDEQGKEVSKFNKIMYQEMPLEALEGIIKNQGYGYKIDQTEMDVCKLFTFAPGLSNSLVLADGYYPLQLGMLPFVVWSYENLFGQRQGLVDLLKDNQEVLNKRQSMITLSLGTAGLNNYFVEADAFQSPAEVQKFKNNQAKGGQTFIVEPGSNNQGKIALQQRPGIPTDLFNAAQEPERLLDKIAGINPATQGQSSANESGVLFSQKVSQSRNAISSQLASLSNQMRIMGEMYFYAAKQVYGGAPRKIKDNYNNKEIEINIPYMDSDGSVKIRNDIGNLPRHEVIVKDSPAGRSKQQEDLTKYFEIKRVSGNPLMQTKLEEFMLPSLGLPQDQIRQMEEASALFYEFQKKQMESQMAQMDMALQQAQQAQQAQGQGQPMDGRAIAKSPGAGPLPNDAGIAGSQGTTNNASQNNAPSDISG